MTTALRSVAYFYPGPWPTFTSALTPFFLGSAFLYPRTWVQPYLQGYILGAVLYS